MPLTSNLIHYMKKYKMNISQKISELEKIKKHIESFCENNNYKNYEIKKHGQRSYIYYYGEDKKIQYISIKDSRVSKIATAKYFKKLLPCLNKELLALKHFRDNYFPQEKYNLINQFPDNIKSLITPVIKDQATKCCEWAEQKFYSCPYEFDNIAEFITEKNERVRSKAEYIIANMLNDMGLAYRYECEYILNSKSVYPDFTIMHPITGELYYLEYFGLMDDEEYAAKTMKKISAYYQTKDAARFIFLFESFQAPMNVKAIKNLLTQIFLTEEFY